MLIPDSGSGLLRLIIFAAHLICISVNDADVLSNSESPFGPVDVLIIFIHHTMVANEKKGKKTLNKS